MGKTFHENHVVGDPPLSDTAFEELEQLLPGQFGARPPDYHEQRPLIPLGMRHAEHGRLAARLERFGTCRDALDIWSALGIGQPARLPLLDTDEFLTATADRRA